MKRMARLLRRAADRLDPPPPTRLGSLLEYVGWPSAYTTSGTGAFTVERWDYPS